MNKAARVTAVVILATFALHATGDRIHAQTPNIVIQWNRLAQAQYGPGASAIPRTLAILHIAMFDAVNAVERVYISFVEGHRQQPEQRFRSTATRRCRARRKR
jgi:hypothetical protein